MAQPAIAGEHAFLAQRRAVSPKASFQGNRSTAGCPLAPAMDLTPRQSGITCRRVTGNRLYLNIARA
jgi:hypothetical protein